MYLNQYLEINRQGGLGRHEGKGNVGGKRGGVADTIEKRIRNQSTRIIGFPVRSSDERRTSPITFQLRSRFAQNLGVAVSSAAQLFSANMIIIGGAAVQFGGDEALDAAKRALQQITILHSQFGLTKVVASNLLPDPATVGAVTLIIEAVMDGQIAMTSRQRN